jgi:cytochrome c556
MKRQFILIVIGIAGIAGVFAAGMASAQQHRPYDQIMKDVGATFASLRKNLDSNSAAAAAQDAARLEGLMTETEAFWAPLNTQDAVGFAKSAREAAAAAGAAAKKNDIKAAQSSAAAVQKNCGSCHFAHREETSKGYLIKP